MTVAQPNTLARTLRQFFSDHLPSVRGLSRHTIHSYRDTLILLLRFLAISRGRSVAELDLTDIEAEDVMAFLDHLEHTRHNTVATRNVRLAALHAFFRYVAVHEPEQLARSQRILHIPFKRADHRTLDYLEYTELQAVLTAADRSTEAGRRIMPCWRRCSTPESGCKNSSTCGPAISTSTNRARCASSARDARSGCVRCGRKLRPCSASCVPSGSSTCGRPFPSSSINVDNR
jgi:integrase